MDIYLFIGSFSSFFRLVLCTVRLSLRGGECVRQTQKKQNKNIDPLSSAASRVITVSCFISTNEKQKNR